MFLEKKMEKIEQTRYEKEKKKDRNRQEKKSLLNTVFLKTNKHNATKFIKVAAGSISYHALGVCL